MPGGAGSRGGPARSLRATLPYAPVGWRAPQFRPLVAGYRSVRGRVGTCPACLRPAGAGNARRVPNVRVETYTHENVDAFVARALPGLFEVAARAAADAGVPIGDSPFLRGPVAVRLRAIHPRPRSSHRVRTGTAREPAACKPDLTNVLKLVEDCCTRARWWKDDDQVAQQATDAFLQAVPAHRCGARCPESDPPRVLIMAWELAP